MIRKFLLGILNFFVMHIGSFLGWIFLTTLNRHAKEGTKYSEKTLLKQIRRSVNTEIGRKYDFASIKSIADFQQKVPYTVYEDYKEYIKRIRENGEYRLMSDSRIIFCARTSGTSSSSYKFIPHNYRILLAYFKSYCIFINDMMRTFRQTGRSSLVSKGILISDTMDEVEKQANKIPDSSISMIAADNMKLFQPILMEMPFAAIGTSEIHDKSYIKARYSLQNPNIKFIVGTFTMAHTDLINYIIDHHDLLIHDIETGTIDPSINMSDKIRRRLERQLRPDPKRANELKEIFAQGDTKGIISKIWKKLTYIVGAGGGNFTIYTENLRSFLDDTVVIAHSIYSSSEAVMGICLTHNVPEYRLMIDDGFYEFIPAESEDEKPLLMADLKPGENYEIVLTNLSGLYRYRLKDVLKVKDYYGETPIFEFAYRSSFISDIQGLHLTEKIILNALKDIEKDVSVKGIDYSVYSHYENNNDFMEIYLEFAENPPIDDKTMTEKLNFYIRKHCDYYGKICDQGVLKPSVAYVLKPGTYHRYREYRIEQGLPANQFKSVHSIPDEKIRSFFQNSVR